MGAGGRWCGLPVASVCGRPSPMIGWSAGCGSAWDGDGGSREGMYEGAGAG